MALTISYVAGYQWTIGELVTEDKLNLAANPTINLEGTIGTVSIADNSVTLPKLPVGVFTADAAGRSRFADQFVVAAKLGADVAGDGLQGGAGAAIAVKPDALTIETSAGAIRLKSTGAGVVANARNLVAFNNAAAANNKADLTADEILLKDGTGNPYLVSTVSVTVDITASGANGLDTGAEASSTWYYLFIIAKADGTKAGLLSVSSTAPTMPATYVYKGLVGAIRNDGSSNFLTFYQQDREIYLNDTVVFTNKTGITSWTAITGADLTAMQGLVPPIAKSARGSAGNTTNNGGIAIGADANALAATAISGTGPGATVLSYALAGGWRVPLKTAQTFYYIMSNAATNYRVSLCGFSI